MMNSLEVSPWRVDQLLRPLFRRFSKVGNKVYFDNSQFPVTKELEDSFDIIMPELNNIMERIDELTPFQEISPDQVYISNDDKWKMFFLKAGTVRFNRNCEECPKTMSILISIRILFLLIFQCLALKKCLCRMRGRGAE